MKSFSKLLCVIALIVGCHGPSDQSSAEKTPNVNAADSEMVSLNKSYSQGEGREEIATLLLRHDHIFEFEDMRDESCWLWYTTFGKWDQEGDTVVLSPNRETNSFVKLQNRKFLLRHDSLIFMNFREKNSYINWGNFGSSNVKRRNL